MNMMAPCRRDDNQHDMSEDLMTRGQVALMFRVTSAAVASWARRGRLPELRNEDGRPRYRRADVEALSRGDGRRRAQ
jgi:DNA-binding transcriptional MerR regulator